MDFATYRQDVFRTVRAETPERERLLIAALGLCGESGEVAENIKKALFQGHEMEVSALRDELGDVLWYSVFLCDPLGLTVDDVMEANVAKRRKRYPDGFSSGRSIQRDGAK